VQQLLKKLGKGSQMSNKTPKLEDVMGDGAEKSPSLTFSKTLFFTEHFLKVNTQPHFIIDDLKIFKSK
jgi:hypothetical protein